MSYIAQNLEPGETIVAQARLRGFAYVYALLLFLLLLVPHRLTGLASTELALTDRRLIGRVGMFRRRFLRLPYAQITGVRVRQGLMGKLLDYGTLIVTAQDGKRYVFHGIAEPVDLQLQIDEKVELAVLGRTLSGYSQPVRWE